MIIDFFVRLLIGHLVGDFVLQPLWLAIAKRQGWRGLILHVSIVTAATTILSYGLVPNGLIWMLVLFVIHLFIDQFRTFVFTNNDKGRGLLLLILDQLAHLISLIFIAHWATDAPTSDLLVIFTQPLSTENILFFIFGIVVISFWVIPIVEIEAYVAALSFQGNRDKKIAPIGLSDRMMGGMERLLGLAVFSIGYGVLSPLFFLPRLFWMVKADTPNKITAITMKVLTSIFALILMGVLLKSVQFI